MRFGPVPLEEAEGAILAHSLALEQGRLRKGLKLDRAAIARLRAAGHDVVTVARLDPTDVAEDAAARRLAKALAPDPEAARLRIGQAATGRANIFATCNGVADIDAARIDAVNGVDPMITVATVPRWQRMAERGMVATVKIISYGVPEDALRRACEAAQGALAMRAVTRRRAVLIQTSVSASENGEKGQKAMALRLQRMGVALGPKTLVPHETGPLADALKSARRVHDVILILTGSATSDWQDTAPQALRLAGGRVAHFGMPVDPGNLLFLGELQGTPVIGLPGCARSPALNGADWVLERILCGVPVRGADIMGMGVGGLLKEPPSRPRPREG